GWSPPLRCSMPVPPSTSPGLVVPSSVQVMVDVGSRSSRRVPVPLRVPPGPSRYLKSLESVATHLPKRALPITTLPLNTAARLPPADDVHSMSPPSRITGPLQTTRPSRSEVLLL